MANLLQETLEMLKDNNLTESDVKWVGSVDGKTTWEQFKMLADKEYNHGYGGEEVNTELRIVGNDWWFERHEYDGSEWWEFKTMPTEPKSKQFKQFGNRWKKNDGCFVFYGD